MSGKVEQAEVLFAVYKRQEDGTYADSLFSDMGIEHSLEPRVVNKNGEQRYFLFINKDNIYKLPEALDAEKNAAEYMLAVYNSSSADFRSNEQVGDRRINLYITLATAVIGGLLVLSTKQFTGSLLFSVVIICAAIIAILAVGIFTFFRMLQRNIVTDEYVRSMKNVGKFFVLRNPRIKVFLTELDPFEEKAVRSKKIGVFKIITGGLLETVAILNGFVAASLPLLVILALNVAARRQDGQPQLILVPLHYILLGISAALLGLGTWVCQIKYALRRYKSVESDTHSEGEANE